ncbi:MAG: toxin-activating lysine-acyltransferase [Rickettsiales bacterium]
MVAEQQNILEAMPPEQRSRLLGDIITLMTQSPAHSNYKIQHFSSVVLPPVQLNQFRIYHDAKKRPVGFVSWAMLSAEAEDKFLNHATPLTMEEWASGDIIYIMEFIAPYGHAQKITADLKKRYPNQKAHAVRYDTTGKNGKVVTTFYGENVG